MNTKISRPGDRIEVKGVDSYFYGVTIHAAIHGDTMIVVARQMNALNEGDPRLGKSLAPTTPTPGQEKAAALSTMPSPRSTVLDVIDRRIEQAKHHPMMPREFAELLDAMGSMLRNLDGRLTQVEAEHVDRKLGDVF